MNCSSQEVRRILEQHDRILLTAHDSPDGEAEGSLMAMQEWLEGLGQDLGLQALGSLESVLGQINGVHLQSLWTYSVDLGKNPDGDSLLNGAYREYLGGLISLEELIDTLTPRLELYLDE